MTGEIMDLIYEKEHTLLMRDCDTFRRLKPSVMLTMFQDASEALTEGWGVGLDAMLARGIIWVAARIDCEINDLPMHNDTVLIRGWATRNRTGIYPFRYEILDAEKQTLVRACAMWVLSDKERHSMLTPNVPRLSLPTPESDDTPLPRMPRVSPPENCQHTTRRVQFSETDINGHLTNTRYIDWACDLVPREFHRTHPMTAVRVDYRSEIFPDEEVTLDWDLTEKHLWCSVPGRFNAELLF